MTLADLALFIGAYALATASPGPGIAALIARVLGHGLTGVVPFIAGFVVGDLIWFAVAAAGMAMLAQTLEGLFLVIRIAGALYLLYLAYRLFTAPAVSFDPEAQSAAAPARGHGWTLFATSLTICLGNPKVIVFFMALLPTVIDLERLTLLGAFEIALAIDVVLSAVLVAYALAAARARRLFRSRRAVQLLNRATGTVMAGAAVGIALR